VRFALMIEPQQGLSYAQQLEIARLAEDAGFETLFRSDHYEGIPDDRRAVSTDAWTVLAGLARETTRIGLGALVSPVTYRLPGSFAKVVLTVDEMSGGRIEVGVGAGWHEDEHRRHGLPFPPIGDRADMLEETLEILHGLWEESDGWSFRGRHWTIEDARFRPKPGSLPGRNGGRPRIIVGGEGSPRSYRIAARYADEFNLTSSSPESAALKLRALDDAVRAAGRDPATLTRAVMTGFLVGRDRDEVRRREAAQLDAMGESGDAEAWLAPRRTRWVYGTADAARAQVARFEAAGAERIVLQDWLPWDLDMISLVAELLLG
jgi:F420-dependent oxidoreductase-like protein